MNTKVGWCMLGAGMVAGAAAALLYAPQAGSQSRRDIRKKSAHLYRQVEEGSEKAYDKTKAVVDGAGKHGKNYLSSFALPVGIWAWQRIARSR